MVKEFGEDAAMALFLVYIRHHEAILIFNVYSRVVLNLKQVLYSCTLKRFVLFYNDKLVLN